MRAAGQVVARILATVRAEAKAGTRLTELDDAARTVLSEAAATSPFLGYQPSFASVPFPAAICTSVNDAALHGIPGPYRLADGDLLSGGCGAVVERGGAPAGRRPPDQDHRTRPAGRDRRRGARRARRGHLGRDRRGRARGGLRDLHGLRRATR